MLCTPRTCPPTKARSVPDTCSTPLIFTYADMVIVSKRPPSDTFDEREGAADNLTSIESLLPPTNVLKRSVMSLRNDASMSD